MEQNKKFPKRQKLPRSVGQEPAVSTSSPVARPKSPIATLAYSRPDFDTKATNTPTRLDWAAGVGLPETQVRLELLDVKKAISGRKRKIRSSGSQRKRERDLSLRRSGPCPLLTGTLVPSADPDQVFLEKQVEDACGPTICSGKRKTRSLGRSKLDSAASRAKCQTTPGQSKPKGDSGTCGLKLVPGQEPPVQPGKRRASRRKACARKEEGEKAVRTAKSPPLSAGQASSAPAPVHSLCPTQVTSPDRLQVVLQSREDEEIRQTDILTASLARDVQYFKKCKKKRLLPGVREKSGPPPSFQEPSCLKSLIQPIKTETHGLDSNPRSPDSLHSTVLKSIPDIRQFFIVDLKNIRKIFCILCQTTVRQRKTQGWSCVSGLVRHLVRKHGLEWERRPTGSPVEGVGGPELQQKTLPTVAASPALGGCLSPRTPRQYPDIPFSGDSDIELALGRPGQLCLPSPLPLSPAAVRDSQDDTHTPSKLRAQSWNKSITELLCSLALPLSFISSQPFRRFMAQVDPCYHLPSPGFFSDRALPLLHEAVGEQVLQEMQWADGAHVHLTASTSAQDSVVSYVAITAHWVPEGQPVASESLRKRAVLLVRGLPLESAEEGGHLELLEQISLWLGRGSLKASFLVSGGCPNLVQMAKAEGYLHIPSFTHLLDSLVNDFLCNHNSVQIILGTARAIFSHFQGCLEARRLLRQLQKQCGLPAEQPFSELSDHWISTYRLMEWVVEQQQALQAYAEKQQSGKASTALSAMFWSLAESLVKLLQPFEMVSREASTAQASLSQVLPQLRYLHIFLEQVHRHFIEQSSGEVDVALRLAEGLALQLSTDCQLNELFYREEFVLATLLDPRFKGRVEAILPVGADIDHWKQVLVYKVKEIMVSECPLSTLGTLRSPRVTTGAIRSPGAKGKGQRESSQNGGVSGTLLLVQREKSLLEQLESVGLLASEKSGASLSTENHMASVIVKKYLRENETVGAQEDPLAYWEKKREVWPALARLATIYLSCPPTGAFSEGVFASLNSPTITEPNSPLKVEAVEHLLFLKTNLESFPHYTPPPLIFSSNGAAEEEQTL